MYLTEQALPKTTLSLEHFHVKEHSSEDQGIVDVYTITIARHIVVAVLPSCYFWLYQQAQAIHSQNN